MHRCAALTRPGWPGTRMQEADDAISQLDRIHGRPTKRAELLLTAARCALAAGAAGQGAGLGRPRPASCSTGRAGVVAGARRAGAGERGCPGRRRRPPPCSGTLSDASGSCPVLGSPDQPLARLATGRVALALGQRAVANEHLAAAAAGRRHGPPLSRAIAWLAEALRAEAAGDSYRLMHACRRGLDVIDEYRSMLGFLRTAGPDDRTRRRAGEPRPAARVAARPSRADAGLERAVAGGRAAGAAGAPARRRALAGRTRGDARHQQQAVPGPAAWDCARLRSSRNSSDWSGRCGPGRCAPWAPAAASRQHGQHRRIQRLPAAG